MSELEPDQRTRRIVLAGKAGFIALAAIGDYAALTHPNLNTGSEVIGDTFVGFLGYVGVHYLGRLANRFDR